MADLIFVVIPPPTEQRYGLYHKAHVMPRFRLGGVGYFKSTFPEHITSVDGVPVSAEVRVLLRNHPNKDYDMLVVAKVQSANDGMWEVRGLNPNFKYDVIARYTGYNDLIMSDLTPKV